MIETKLIGTTLISSAEFKNELGEKIAPMMVNIKYKKPTGSIVTMEIVPTGTKYSASVLLDEAGDWNFRWESITGNTVADEFSIFVLNTLIK